jgi:hypothetical protein
MRRALYYRKKEQCSTKKIEPNALMTIFLAERRIVNYYMCGIG